MKLAGLPRTATFTNLKPIEQDANAASAMYIRNRFPQAVDSLLDDIDDAPLVRSLTPPGRHETLVARMIAFLFLYEELCSAFAEEWTWSFSEFLEHDIAPGAGALWENLSTAANGFEFWPEPRAG
jgi:hypothetical protein